MLNVFPLVRRDVEVPSGAVFVLSGFTSDSIAAVDEHWRKKPQPTPLQHLEGLSCHDFPSLDDRIVGLEGVPQLEDLALPYICPRASIKRCLGAMLFLSLLCHCGSFTAVPSDADVPDTYAPGPDTYVGWVTIRAGRFIMGSPEGEPGRHMGTEEQHEVVLTHDFLISATEVTQPEFEAVMGFNHSFASYCRGACPVDHVSWHQAAFYCNALSDAVDLDRCYDCTGVSESPICEPNPGYATPYDCPGFRLPTEAEWEYAARAGTTTATYNGDLDDDSCDSAVVDPIEWYCGNSDHEQHEAASLEPNPWGLYDMLGSVEEWCHDWFDFYPEGPVTDPWGPAEERLSFGRSHRSGNYRLAARGIRAAVRGGTRPDYEDQYGGFRPAKTIDP